jgi:hypothetical protein
MNKNMIKMLAAMALAGIIGSVYAGEDIVSDVAAGCAAETEQYCSQVTLGEGRLLACFYAHEDKLSSECVNTLYTAFDTLSAEVNALTHVAEQCSGDIETFCAETEMGEGRVAQCLGYHSEELSESCSNAIEGYLAQ